MHARSIDNQIIIIFSHLTIFWKEKKEKKIKKPYKSKTHGKDHYIIFKYPEFRENAGSRNHRNSRRCIWKENENESVVKDTCPRHACIWGGIKLNQRAFSVLDRKQISQNYCWLADWLLFLSFFNTSWKWTGHWIWDMDMIETQRVHACC